LKGATSAGKSSFINKLLGFQLKRTRQASEDDQFTIIEIVSEIEFNKSGSKRRLSRHLIALNIIFLIALFSFYSLAEQLSDTDLMESHTIANNDEWLRKREAVLFRSIDATSCFKRFVELFKKQKQIKEILRFFIIVTGMRV
jgi:hypothetical protein